MGREKQALFDALLSVAGEASVREKLAWEIFQALIEHPKLQKQEFKALLIKWRQTITDFENEYQKYQDNQRWFYPYGYQRLYYYAQDQMQKYCTRRDVFERYIKDARKKRVLLGDQGLALANNLRKPNTGHHTERGAWIALSWSWPSWTSVLLFASTANSAVLQPIVNRATGSNNENISGSAEIGQAFKTPPVVATMPTEKHQKAIKDWDGLGELALYNRRIVRLLDLLPQYLQEILYPSYKKLKIKMNEQNDDLISSTQVIENVFDAVLKCYDELSRLAAPFIKKGLLKAENQFVELPASYIRAEPHIRTLIKLTQHLMDYLLSNANLDHTIKNHLASISKNISEYDELPISWHEKLGSGTPKEKLRNYMKARAKWHVYEKYLPEILKHGVKYAHERGIQTPDISTCALNQVLQQIPAKFKKYLYSTNVSEVWGIAFEAGEAYREGRNGVAVDRGKANTFFSMAAANGHSAASIRLFEHYVQNNEMRLAALLLEQACLQSPNSHSCLLAFVSYYERQNQLRDFDPHFDANYRYFAQQAKEFLVESELQSGLKLASASARDAFYEVFDEKFAFKKAILSAGLIYPSVISQPPQMISRLIPSLVSAQIQASEFRYLLSHLPGEIQQSQVDLSSICDNYLYGIDSYPKNPGLALRWARYWFFNGDLTMLRFFKYLLLPKGELTHYTHNADMIAAVMTPIGENPQSMPQSVALAVLEAAKQRVAEQMFALGAIESIDAAHFLASIQAMDHHNFRLANQLILQTVEKELDYGTATILVKTLVTELQILMQPISSLPKLYNYSMQEYHLRRQQITLIHQVASHFFKSHLKENALTAQQKRDLDILANELNDIIKNGLPVLSTLAKKQEDFSKFVEFSLKLGALFIVMLLSMRIIFPRVCQKPNQSDNAVLQQPSPTKNKSKPKASSRKHQQEDKKVVSEMDKALELADMRKKQEEDKKKKYFALKGQISLFKCYLDDYGELNAVMNSKVKQLEDAKHLLVEAERQHSAQASNAQKANKKWREYKKITYDDKIKNLDSDMRSCINYHTEYQQFVDFVENLTAADYLDEQWEEKLESLESLIFKLTMAKSKLDEWREKNAKTQAAEEIEKKKNLERQIAQERQVRFELIDRLKRFVKSPDMAHRIISEADVMLRKIHEAFPGEACEAFNTACDALTEQCYALIMLMTKDPSQLTIQQLQAYVLECENADTILNQMHPLQQEVQRQYTELLERQAEVRVEDARLGRDQEWNDNVNTRELMPLNRTKNVQIEYQRMPSAAAKSRNDKIQAERALDIALGWLKNPISLILQDLVKHANQVEKDYSQYPLIGFYSLFYSLHELQLLVLTAHLFHGKEPELSIPPLFVNKNVGEFSRKFWNLLMHGFFKVDYVALLACVRKSYCEALLVNQRPVYKAKMIHEGLELEICQTQLWENLRDEQQDKKYFTVYGAMERLQKVLEHITKIVDKFVLKDLDRAQYQRMAPHYTMACKMLITIIGQINQDLLFNIEGAEVLRQSKLFKTRLEPFLLRCHKKIRNLERHGANKEDEALIIQRLLDMQADNNKRTATFDYTTRDEVEALIQEACDIYKNACRDNLFDHLLHGVKVKPHASPATTLY